MSTSQVPSYNSYVDYIGSLLREWPEYYGLHLFLKWPIGTQGRSSITLIDCRNESFDIQTIFPNEPDLASYLRSRPPETKTRLVILEYDDARKVDRKMLDAIGLQYDLDPLFYCNHFGPLLAQGWDKGETPNVKEIHMVASHKFTLEVGVSLGLHASILAVPEKPNNTNRWNFIILLRDSRGCEAGAHGLERPSIHSPHPNRRIGIHKRLLRRYLSILENWSTFDIRAVAEAPIELLYPIYQLIALEICKYQEVNNFAKDKVLSLGKIPEAALIAKEIDYDFHAELYRISMEMVYEDTKSILDTLQNARVRDPGWISLALETPKWAALIGDYEILLVSASKNLKTFEELEARRIASASLQASIASLTQSGRVGLITTLAFFFIPLSFVTSFFGMNIAELGTGEVGIKIFIITTIGVFGFVFTIWSLSIYLSSTFAKIKDGWSAFRARATVLKQFAVISPRGALWLTFFSFVHPPMLFQEFLLELGIWRVLGLGDEWHPPEFGGEGSAAAPRLSPFWRRRGSEIMKITSIPGWHRESFLSRLRKSKKT